MRRVWDRKNSPRARYSDEAAFRRARLQLTGWYALTLGAIVIVFSLTLYAALATQLAQHGGNQADPVPQQVERDTVGFALSRLRLILVAGDLVFLAAAACGAHLLAGRTLRPIAAAMERQRRFSADASHELRTPLTVMRGAIDVALRAQRPPEAYQQTLAELREEVDSMTRLVVGLLLLARGGARPPEATAAFDVQAILQDVVSATAEVAASRGSTVRLTPAPPLMAKVDRGEARQVFLNLVMNALQHTPSGTTVSVEGQRRDNAVQVTVSDDGPGIAVEQRARVFEPFFRAGTAAHDGSGLGLALSRELVEANGGSISLIDSARGATFRVRLPLAVRH